MGEKDVTFKAGDKVVSKEKGTGGTISRLCGDPTVIFVKWDDRPTQQEMVDVSSLKALGNKG